MVKKRSETEMMALILKVAMQEETVRAVVLQGSRANAKIPKDDWQDFDIVYLVEDIENLTSDHQWIDQFGERIILQMPETMQLPAPAHDGTFAYLMLFTDGNRIDLTIVPCTLGQEKLMDSLSVLLLDKDDRFNPFPLPDERDYYVQAPTEQAFRDCCNEFWWTTTNVAKALGREEVVNAKAIQEKVVRTMLDQMICWQIGAKYGFTVNPGKNGRFFKQYLSEDHWRELVKTYSDATRANIWASLLAMTRLFEQVAKVNASHFGFIYPAEEAQNVKVYLMELYRNQLS